MTESLSDISKQRFNKLLDYYAVALYLSYQIIDSGLLEKKIKVSVNNVERLAKQYLSVLASELRNADKLKSSIITNTNSDYFASDTQIADAYFYELSARGDEWEYADLAPLFVEYRSIAEEQLDND